MQTFVRELGRIAIFMICAQLIVYFRPKESYEKYLKLLMNLLILLQFLTPIKAFFERGVGDAQAELMRFRAGLEAYEEEGRWGGWEEEGNGDWNGAGGWQGQDGQESGAGESENSIQIRIDPIEEVAITEMTGGEDEP